MTATSAGRRRLVGATYVLALIVGLSGCGAATANTASLRTRTPTTTAPATISRTSDVLTGTRWVLTTLMFGGGSHESTGSAATLQFARDGTVAYSDGCNGGGGTYQVVGAHLDLDLRGTQKACDDTDSQQVARVLHATPWFTVDAGTLTLYDGTPGGVGVAYARATSG